MLIEVEVQVEEMESGMAEDPELEDLDIELEGVETQEQSNEKEVEEDYKSVTIRTEDVKMIQETHDGEHSILFLNDLITGAPRADKKGGMHNPEQRTAVMILKRTRKDLQNFVNKKLQEEAQWS